MSSSVLDLAKEVQDLENQLGEKKGQLLSALGANGVSVAVVPAKTPGKKRGRPAGSGKSTVRAKRTNADGSKSPPAHVAVKSILKRHKNGLVLADVTKELDVMRQKGEFQSNAKSLTNIASVALQKLKTDKEARRDNDSTCWLAVG